MTSRTSQTVSRTATGLGPIATLRRAAVFLKQLQQLLKTPDGITVTKFCAQHRTYVPLSPEVTIGTSFSDGSSVSTPQIQVIAATERGLLVLRSHSTLQRQAGDMLAYPALAHLPGLKQLSLAMALGPAMNAGFTIAAAEQKIRQTAQLIRDGVDPRTLRA